MPLLQDYGMEADFFAGAKPYSYYEDICRADDTRYYNTRNGLTGPEIFNGYSNRSVDRYIENVAAEQVIADVNTAEQVIADVNTLSDTGFDGLQQKFNTSDINNQITVQKNNFEIINSEKSNTHASNLNNKDITDRISDSVNNVKTVEYPSVEGNVNSGRIETEKANQIQIIESQSRASKIALPRTCINKSTALRLNIENSFGSRNDTGSSIVEHMAVENADSDTLSANDSVHVETNEFESSHTEEIKTSIFGKFRTEDVTVAVLKKSEDKDDIAKAEDGTEDEKHKADGYNTGKCSELVSSSRESTVVSSAKNCNVTNEKLLPHGTVSNTKVEKHGTSLDQKNPSRDTPEDKKTGEAKAVDEVTEMPCEKDSIVVVPKHNYKDKPMKKKARMGNTTTDQTEMSPEKVSTVVLPKTSHSEISIQKKLRNTIILDKIPKDEIMKNCFSVYTNTKQRHELIKKGKSWIANCNKWKFFKY